MKKLILILATLLLAEVSSAATQSFTITFTATTQKLSDAADDLANFYGGYKSTLSNGDANPETKLQFITRMIGLEVKDHVKFQRGKTSGQTARQAAFDDVDTLGVN